MRKILIALLGVLLVAALAGAGTFAYFSDTETSTGNSFTAGTLDLGLANAAGLDPTGSTSATWVSPSNWAPGQTVDASIYVNNEGTIGASRTTVTFTYSATEGTPSSVDAGSSLIGDAIVATTVELDGVTVTGLQGKTLSQLQALGAYDLGSLPANTEKKLHIVWTLDPNADNGVQGDSANVTLSFKASQ
ncbi:camelysin [Thermodesulfitimonas autotrophica]|uniref:Camelysin n=1 Tax=Thermodesulfitimonas autotrophica TaxID=1894989 RepID=A0A3N5BBG6_9THEO|nr:TasA family protein [Thermodesulfitimonas autotrophica]RPF43055.1 camelysin [Thermodesulfitimonas autotrophica]